MGRVSLFLTGLSFAGNLLFFYDPQCPYCEMQAQELLKHRDCLSRHNFYAIDINENPNYSRAWGVKTVPTLILQEGRYYITEGVLVGKDLRKFLRCE